MMIGSQSRYQSAVIQTVDAPDGTRQEMRIPFPRSRMVSFTFYLTKAGDRPDTLAGRFLNNPNLWWMIADANPEILDWSHIRVGQTLRIPNV